MVKKEEPKLIAVPIGGGTPQEWTEICKILKERLEKANPKDRLDLAVQINECILDLTASVQGWKSWYIAEFVQGSAKIISNFTQEELENVFMFLRNITVSMLEFDIAMGKLMKSKFEQLERIEPTVNKNEEYVR